MEPVFREILNTKLIPDLINIINDYLLTPLDYFKLIDNKKYTYDEYRKYEKEYNIKIAETIYQKWKLDSEIPNSVIKNVGSPNRNLKFFDFKSLNRYKSLLDKYISIFITEFKNANIIEIEKFEKVSDHEYKIYGNLLYKFFLSLDKSMNSKVTVIYDFSGYEKDWITIINDPMRHWFKIDMSPLWKTYTDILKENYILNEKILSLLFGIPP